MARIAYSNETDGMLGLVIEPWANDYWLAPGDRFEIEAPEPDVWFEVAHHKDLVLLWVNGPAGTNHPSIRSQGVELECAHQRPPNAFSAPQKES